MSAAAIVEQAREMETRAERAREMCLFLAESPRVPRAQRAEYRALAAEAEDCRNFAASVRQRHLLN